MERANSDRWSSKFSHLATDGRWNTCFFPWLCNCHSSGIVQLLILKKINMKLGTILKVVKVNKPVDYILRTIKILNLDYHFCNMVTVDRNVYDSLIALR